MMGMTVEHVAEAETEEEEEKADARAKEEKALGHEILRQLHHLLLQLPQLRRDQLFVEYHLVTILPALDATKVIMWRRIASQTGTWMAQD
jgi:uncharacterized membrane protein YqiK